MQGVSQETAAAILYGGATLYNFSETDFAKADAAREEQQVALAR